MRLASKGEGSIGFPAPGKAHFLQEAAAQCDALALLPEQRQEVAEVTEGVGDDLGDLGAEAGEGVTAVEPAAEQEAFAERVDLGAAVQRLGAHHGDADFQLRQAKPEIAAEQAGPGAAGENHGVAGDAAFLGHRGGDATALGFDAANGAVGENDGAGPASGGGDGGGGFLRLGSPVAGRVERGLRRLAHARQQRGDLVRADHAAVELVLFGDVEPAFAAGDFLIGIAEIHHAGGAKACFAFDHRVHLRPQAQAFDDQRDFAGVSSGLPAPAGVAAGLLAGDLAFFAEHDGHAGLGEKECGGGTDDAAADNHHAGARRRGFIDGDRINGRAHEGSC